MKVTNGKDVARLLVDEYLNCHPTGHKKFMDSMAKEQQEIKDNYTYLPIFQRSDITTFETKHRN